MRVLPGLAVLGLALCFFVLVMCADGFAGRQQALQGLPDTILARMAARSGVELALLACSGNQHEAPVEVFLGGARFVVRWHLALPGTSCPYVGENLGEFVRILPRRSAPAIGRHDNGFWNWLGFGREPLSFVQLPERERSWWISSQCIGEQGDANLRGFVTVRD